MKNMITYEQISPLVKHVEIVSDMVHCHFYCSVKLKKIVAITCMSKLKEQEKPESYRTQNYMKYVNLLNFKKHFIEDKPENVVNEELEKENAILHAFQKISERFMWSETHNHFIYKF